MAWLPYILFRSKIFWITNNDDKILTKPVFALRLLAAVGVKKVVPADAVQRAAFPAKVPLATGHINNTSVVSLSSI